MAYIGRTPTGSILTSADIADGSISTAKLEDNAVTTAKITDNAVTAAKYVEYPAYRNLIINGDMSIAQRGTSSTGISGNGYFSVDRFKHIISGLGTWTASQSTDVPTGQGFANSFKMDCTTADASPAAGDYNVLAQIVEGANVQHLKKGTSSAESITWSFWVKSNKTGTYICEIFDSNNTRQISKSYTISSANTWEKKIISFSGDTSGAIGTGASDFLQFNFWLAVGSDRSSGTLNTSWNSTTNANRAVGQVNLADSTSNEWYITGIQLEVGTTASDFEFLPYDVTFQRCQRYFEKCEGGQTLYISNTHNPRVTVPFSVKKRASPTLTKTRQTENCCSSVQVVLNDDDETLGARVRANNAFATGADKFYEATFTADAEL